MGGNSVVNPMGSNFLATGGTRLNKPLSFVSPLNKGFLGGGMTGRIGRDVATMGLGEFTQKDPFGIPGNPIASLFGNGDDSHGGIDGPFTLDPAQFEADRAAINDLGTRQYADTQKFIDSDTTDRAASREALAKALTNQAQASFQQGLPATLEDLNARHLLNGSGLGQELARQQGNVATNIANEVGVQGAKDIDWRSGLNQQALAGRQGFETGALQRGLSLEDFVNSANVSKSIGAAFTPVQPSGKQNFGAAAQGVGALASLAKLALK